MFVISNNLVQDFYNKGLEIPKGSVIRVNLAWQESLDCLRKNLNFIRTHALGHVWIDFPVDRQKPPNNQYSVQEIKQVYEEYSDLCYYIGISNVRQPNDILEYVKNFPRCHIVPKIENLDAVYNIREILDKIPGKVLRYIMVDREDLFADCVRHNCLVDRFLELVESIHVCAEQLGVCVLELKGVVFES